MEYPYIVIDRPGYYGNEGHVYSRHRTIWDATHAARKGDYTDERGELRRSRIVAHNPDNRYRKGNTFYSNMPPTPVLNF